MPKKQIKKMSKELNPLTSFKHLTLIFFCFYVLNVIVVYFANSFFPESIVLGHHFYTPMHALLQSMAIMTLIITSMIPIVETLGNLAKVKLQMRDWLIIYALVDIFAIWFTARFAELLGFGISSWIIAVVLGIVIDLLQGALMLKVVNKLM